MHYLIVFVLMAMDVFLQSYFRNLDIGVPNKGITLGLLSQYSTPSILTLYSVVILLLILFYIRERSFQILLIIAGGMGNLLSRLYYGEVWDYISIDALSVNVNISDLLISAGVVWLICNILLHDGDRSNI